MQTVSFTKARNNLKSVLDRVVEDVDYTLISRRDTEDAVIMSLSQFNSWKETLYLLSNPANAEHLMASIAQLEAGNVVKHTLIDG
ncbi:YefM protein (antitoxin to YoeB) [hydrothermal vent metagenome]|uniref:YefM protein (Antitoxin to YoeB) n=1 Tax=hydrothermal vent metagenome TaxID=652676 RepID=A0A1W1DZF7_9ZZZZ|nr:type II toxin-antitoxin system prevent-host-death family antitoxin [Gammaproteobacteria bacterium]